MIRNGIRQAIEEFQIEQVIDYERRGGEIVGDPIWYLRIVAKDDQQELRSLRPIQLALLRLMYEQDARGHPGEMMVENARKELAERGYAKSETEYVWIDGRIERCWTIEDDGRIEWFRVIPEREKTPEYKAAMEEAQRERDEKEELVMRLIEEDERAEERREKRRTRQREKRSQQQSV